MPSPLTARQSEVLAFLQRYMRAHSRPPTMKEIGSGVGISSTSAVSKALGALETKGHIVRTPNVSRGLKLSQPDGSAAVRGASAVPYLADAFDRDPAVLRELADGTMHLDPSLLAGCPADEVLVATLADDGVANEGIRKGDRVVVHLLSKPHMKEAGLALAVLNEQLVARFIHFASSMWHVKPSARHYSAQTFSNSDPAFYPVGKVLSILRIVTENEAS
jgi:repressor LexA